MFVSQPAALTFQVIEDSGNDVGIFNARNESDCTTALLADCNIYAEYSFKAACPRHRTVLFCGSNACDADLNNDGTTNFLDLAQFSQAFNSSGADADFNGDGKVDFLDLDILRDFFLLPPGPSGVF